MTDKLVEPPPVTEATCGSGNTKLSASVTVSVPEMTPPLSAPAKLIVFVTAPVPAGATTGEVYVKLSGPPTQCEPSGVVFVVQ